MQAALLRVGIDTGCGGINGPLFGDGSFEYIPIPDDLGADSRTYGNSLGRSGRKLLDFFPPKRRPKMSGKSIHFDPEFETFTYGDPSRLKARLRRLDLGDMLIFYCGLEGHETGAEPALYLMGFFEVLTAGRADEYSSMEIQRYFGRNFHVRHPVIFEGQKHKLILVKGTEHSRLLNKAVKISSVGQDRRGRPLKILSPKMQQVFGDLGGKPSIQRSPPRWIDPAHADQAIRFMRSLE
jgi:hypothetical protein